MPAKFLSRFLDERRILPVGTLTVDQIDRDQTASGSWVPESPHKLAHDLAAFYEEIYIIPRHDFDGK